MSEEFKCPSCGGTASIAYHRAGDNLLYCQDCQKTFSERYAKIRKQAARIAEQEQMVEALEQERNKLEDECIKVRETYEPKIIDLEFKLMTIKDDHNRLMEALVKLKECLEGYFGKTEKDFFEDCNEDSGELYFADVYNAAVNALKKARGEA